MYLLWISNISMSNELSVKLLKFRVFKYFGQLGVDLTVRLYFDSLKFYTTIRLEWLKFTKNGTDKVDRVYI